VSVSVIVPTFNRAEFLGQALDSLLGQTLPPEQVIVVDDGSTDGTAAVAEPYLGRTEFGQSTSRGGTAGRVVYVRQPNGGKSAAVNTGLELARGEYVWVFDDDDVAVPDALARFVAALDGHPEHGFAFSTCFFTTSRDDDSLGEVIGTSSVPDLEQRGLLLPLLEANFLGGAMLFARSSCYETVGPFDERLVRSQDYDMAIRIARRFSGIRVAGGPTHHLRQHGGLRGSEQDRFAVEERNLRWREYDGIVFRRVRSEMRLEEYLPPGVSLEGRLRQAHLQRFSVLATHLPRADLLPDLGVITELDAGEALSAEERAIWRTAIVLRGYGHALARQPEFLDEVRRLAGTSRTGRSLRAEVLRSMAADVRVRNLRVAARRIVGAAARAVRLFHAPTMRLSSALCRDGHSDAGEHDLASGRRWASATHTAPEPHMPGNRPSHRAP